MYPKKAAYRSKKRQGGLGLPAALFIIVVLSLIALAITELERDTAVGFGYDVLSVRAFYAAESGAQVAVVRALPPTGAGSCSPLSIDFDDPLLSNPGLSSCSAAVSCVADTSNLGEAYYTFKSTGTCGDGAGQTTRVIEVRAH